MFTKALSQFAALISVALLTSNCAYFDKLRQHANYSRIEGDISESSLRNAEKFIGSAPYSKAFEFSFINAQQQPFSLLFTVHENSFSKSTLRYRNANILHRNADRIDENMEILIALNKNLPHPDEIFQDISEQFPVKEFRESYSIMLQYIRFKIRNS